MKGLVRIVGNPNGILGFFIVRPGGAGGCGAESALSEGWERDQTEFRQRVEQLGEHFPHIHVPAPAAFPIFIILK